MHTLVWSPHPYIPTCGRSLRFSCLAAEGVTGECTLRVLLLTLNGRLIMKLILHTADTVITKNHEAVEQWGKVNTIKTTIS